MPAGAARAISHHEGGIFMKSVKLLAACLLLACSLTAQAAEEREQTYVVGADVNVEGHVTATQFDPNVLDAFFAARNEIVQVQISHVEVV